MDDLHMAFTDTPVDAEVPLKAPLSASAEPDNTAQTDQHSFTRGSKAEERLPLGMSSFGCKEREKFGQSVRLAMSLCENPPKPASNAAIPSDKASISARLKLLSKEMTSQHADLLQLLVRFDDLEGWKAGGASHCAAWMNLEIGISLQLSREYLRVGRKLESLPLLRALFRAGKLSWSKVRLISRVADKENEPLLCHAALDASVSDVKRFCEAYRWSDSDNNEEGEAARQEQALKQWNDRSFTWNETYNGSTRIQLTLPPEIAQAFLNSVEHSLNQLNQVENSENSENPQSPQNSENHKLNMSQRRADAAVLMAENSLQSAGKSVSTADRYQVMLSVEATDLIKMKKQEMGEQTKPEAIPKKHPTIRGAGPIAIETVRRYTCDCSLSVNKTVSGEPVDIGRKSRIWPTAMERAIKERDQTCVWPGCTQSRHLHIHHIKHWADGGVTSIDNGACLCSHHHTMVHEGGYHIQRIDEIDDNDDNDEHRLNEQFNQQRRTEDIGMCDLEIALRSSRESFNAVRQLQPNSYRFRIIDAQGKMLNHTGELHQPSKLNPCMPNPCQSNRSANNTRVSCSEPTQAEYYNELVGTHTHLYTHEVPPNYAFL